jgi:hypothetical protein
MKMDGNSRPSIGQKKDDDALFLSVLYLPIVSLFQKNTAENGLRYSRLLLNYTTQLHHGYQLAFLGINAPKTV